MSRKEVVAGALLLVGLTALLCVVASLGTGSGSKPSTDEADDSRPTSQPAWGFDPSEEGTAEGPKRWERATENGKLTRSERAFDVPVSQAAERILGEYAEDGWALVQAGRLGLFSDCWGCVVMAPDQVQVCVLSSQGEEQSHASVLSLEPADWAPSEVQEE